MMVPTVEGKVLEQLDESFEEEEEVAQALAIRAVFVVFSITGRTSWVASRAACVRCGTRHPIAREWQVLCAFLLKTQKNRLRV